MIDTVKLSLPEGSFKILNPQRFTPHADLILKPNRYQESYTLCIQNPPKNSINHGVYLPKLALWKGARNGGHEIRLDIEFSAPKLLYGNNVRELNNRDFQKVVYALRTALYDMEIEVTSKVLSRANVSTIHYSKNVLIENGLSPACIIQELQKVDLSAKIDIGTEKFRNGGQSLHFQTNSRDLVFYDKVKDIQRTSLSPKKALDHNSAGFQLLPNFADLSNLQILRMEIRLGNRTEIKSQLDNSLCRACNPTFENLFSQEISQSVLSYWWNEITDECHYKFGYTKNFTELYKALKFNNPSLDTKQLMKLATAIKLIEEEGAREAREILGYAGNSKADRKWYALRKQLKQLNFQATAHSCFDEVSKALQDFHPIQL